METLGAGLGAMLIVACASSSPPDRATLLDGSIGAGAQIYPQLLALAFPADDDTGDRPAVAYLSRSLCTGGEPVKSLRLGPELQDLLSRNAGALRMEARWVDSRAVFEHAEAADSGDALVCFGAVRLVDPGAQVELSVGTRDGTQESTTYAFSYRDGRWRLEPGQVESER